MSYSVSYGVNNYTKKYSRRCIIMTQEQFNRFILGIQLGYMDIIDGREYLMKMYPSWVLKYDEIF